MELHLGESWYIQKDQHNWILLEKQDIKEGKLKGGNRLVPRGYYSSMETLIRGAIEKGMADPQIRSIVDLRLYLDNICKSIKETILSLKDTNANLGK